MLFGYNILPIWTEAEPGMGSALLMRKLSPFFSSWRFPSNTREPPFLQGYFMLDTLFPKSWIRSWIDDGDTYISSSGPKFYTSLFHFVIISGVFRNDDNFDKFQQCFCDNKKIISIKLCISRILQQVQMKM